MSTVIVLMATYNGEKYLEEQIDSIMQQKDVCIRLYIRDDGSTDNTVGILRKMQNRYKEQLHWKAGKNIGYRRGFLQLLKECQEADYYAFSDQDDVWEPYKISRAVRLLSDRDGGQPLLYASALYLTDSNLQNRVLKKYDKSRQNLKGHILRGGLSGCTFVFNQMLREKANRVELEGIPEPSCPSHDAIVAACAYALGEVVVDEQSFILHRRHESSWGADGRSWTRRIKAEFTILFSRTHVSSILANKLLGQFEHELKSEDRMFLETVANNSGSMGNRWKLIRYPGFCVDNKMINILTYLKILIGRY
jgi:rhamnosyltransferase